jgi:hypothetical protein
MRLSAIIALLMLVNSAQAQTSSDEVARKGGIAFSAFQCSIFAARSDEAEAERLFLFAMEQGRQFFEAVIQGQITDQSQVVGIPFVVQLRLRGPTADFILGRLYEAVVFT